MSVYRSLLLLLLLGLAGVCHGDKLVSQKEQSNGSGVYYVSTESKASDQNLGSIDKPWRRLQFAIDQLKAGDTLYVMPGIYQEKLLLSGDKHSGGADRMISIIGKAGVIIDGSDLSPQGREGLVTLRDVRYLRIEGLEIRNFRTAKGEVIEDTPIGLLIEGVSSHITVKNNKIHHIENLSRCGQSSDCGTGANGIAVYGNTPTTITDLLFYKNEVSHCVLSSSEAFTLNGNISGFQLIENFVHDNNNIGIDVIGYEDDVCSDCKPEQNRARNGVLKGNRAINNSTRLSLAGFDSNPWYEDDEGSAGGFYVDGGHHIVFNNNVSSKNDLGVEFASEHAGKSSEELVFVNNRIFLNREAGLVMGGYAKDKSAAGGGNARKLYISNNSFYKNKGWGSEIVFSWRVSDALIKNNIIYGRGVLDDLVYQEDGETYQRINWGKNQWWAENVDGANGLPGNVLLANPGVFDVDKEDFLSKPDVLISGDWRLQKDIPVWARLKIE